jgi:uncharacterized membrane protein YvbJ
MNNVKKKGEIAMEKVVDYAGWIAFILILLGIAYYIMRSFVR